MNWEPEWHPQKIFLTKAVKQDYESDRMVESYEDRDPPQQGLLQQTHLDLNYSSVDIAENLEKTKVSDYVPYKNKTPRAYDTHVSRQV